MTNITPFTDASAAGVSSQRRLGGLLLPSTAHLRIAALLMLPIAVAGCAPALDPPTSTASPSVPPAHSGSGEIRHELDPLTDRFPQLAGATSATWMSGTLGDGRAPGPSTYWIDAILTFDEAGYATLRAHSDPQPTTERPELDPGLDPFAPTGPLFRSDALDADFSADERRTRVYLDDDSASLILTSWFE